MQDRRVTVEELLKLVVSLGDRAPQAAAGDALDGLFRELRSLRPRRPLHEVEDAIWAAWASHPDPAVQRQLQRATEAIAAADYGRARRLLDPLVESWPHWAEAWNQRATLSYLEGRDAESFADIKRALELEPRHFGALCGFGQVCLRRGERAAALAAFETALAIHPQLQGLRAAVDDLQETMLESVH